MRTRVVASAQQTRGRYSLYRLELAPRSGGAGPHFHRTFTESFFVLAGTVRLYDGRGWSDTSEGDHLVVPEGAVHAFSNDSDGWVAMLMMSTPGAPREEYFRELAEVAARDRPLSDAGRTALYTRHDTFMV